MIDDDQEQERARGRRLEHVVRRYAMPFAITCTLAVTLFLALQHQAPSASVTAVLTVFLILAHRLF